MLTKTRQEEILKLLESRGSVTLQGLKEYLNTSESTIRRDLNTLDAQGKLVKVFGGAVAVDNMNIRDEQVARREEKNLEEKQKIARLYIWTPGLQQGVWWIISRKQAPSS